jgi:hypothetical protein
VSITFGGAVQNFQADKRPCRHGHAYLHVPTSEAWWRLCGEGPELGGQRDPSIAVPRAGPEARKTVPLLFAARTIPIKTTSNGDPATPTTSAYFATTPARC